MALLQLLVVIGTLTIAKTQTVAEYDYELQNPVGRRISEYNEYYEYETHFTPSQCPDITTYNGVSSLEMCTRKCDESARCSAVNYAPVTYWNKQGQCTLKACGRYPPLPAGAHSFALKGLIKPPAFIHPPTLVFRKKMLWERVNSAAELPCGYAPPSGEIRGCRWRNPDGKDIQVWDVQDGLVAGKSLPSHRYYNQCGIVLDRVQARDYGNWTCMINIQGQTLRGTLWLIELSDREFR